MKTKDPATASKPGPKRARASTPIFTNGELRAEVKPETQAVITEFAHVMHISEAAAFALLLEGGIRPLRTTLERYHRGLDTYDENFNQQARTELSKLGLDVPPVEDGASATPRARTSPPAPARADFSPSAHAGNGQTYPNAGPASSAATS